MRIPVSLAPLAFLALAACGSDPAPTGPAPAGMTDPSAPASGSGGSAASVGTTLDRMATQATPDADTRAVFPVAFQGRWGVTKNDCDPSRGDAKGGITIAKHTIAFFESRATPRSIVMAEPLVITTTLDFEGEGQQWNEPTTLAIVGDGRTLERRANVVWTYQRCEV